MTIRLSEQFPNGSIICLESPGEEYYSWSLSTWIAATIESQDEDAKAAIRSLWNDEDAWDDIVKKTKDETSAWYVWWMDGVRKYRQIDLRDGESTGADP